MSGFQDLTGQQSGTLIAREYLGGSKWRCECIKCGNTVDINTCTFNENKWKQRDGCKHVKPILPGSTFGLLSVVEQVEDYIKPKSRAHERQWKCKCICGREKIIIESNLKCGKSTTCGLCNNRVSIPEKMIYFYLSQVFCDIQENYRPLFLNGKEIDIFIPSLMLGIEYDGERWHKDAQLDTEKNDLCSANNIRLIRIREPKCSLLGKDENQIVTPKPTNNGTHMTAPIKQLLQMLEDDYSIACHVDVDCLRDNAEICKTIVSTVGFNSLKLKCPSIADEWDYEKNYPLTPDKVPFRAGKKAWWICPRGHSYSSVIASRTGEDKCGCPICSNKGKSLYQNGRYVGNHSLAKERPDIAAEFDEIKNGISANDISVSSNKKMWFKCSKCGYEWESKVNNRTSSNNQGCPVCGKEKVRRSKCKPVICVETNQVYESATEAERQLHIPRGKVSACCTGRQETSGGYHWKFVQLYL